MDRADIEKALALAVDAESLTGIKWWPGEAMAPIAYRRWNSFSRRCQTKHPTEDQRIRDLADGLQAHYEPKTPFTHRNEWRHLAQILAAVFAEHET